MSSDIEQEILRRTKRLVNAGTSGDLDTFQKLVAEDITAVEPESNSVPVEGDAFHEFYFRLDRYDRPVNNTITDEHIRVLDEDKVLIVYTRLTQLSQTGNEAETKQFTETRVWERRNGDWKNVHLHRTRV